MLWVLPKIWNIPQRICLEANKTKKEAAVGGAPATFHLFFKRNNGMDWTPLATSNDDSAMAVAYGASIKWQLTGDPNLHGAFGTVELLRSKTVPLQFMLRLSSPAMNCEFHLPVVDNWAISFLKYRTRTRGIKARRMTINFSNNGYYRMIELTVAYNDENLLLSGVVFADQTIKAAISDG